MIQRALIQRAFNQAPPGLVSSPHSILSSGDMLASRSSNSRSLLTSICMLIFRSFQVRQEHRATGILQAPTSRGGFGLYGTQATTSTRRRLQFPDRLLTSFACAPAPRTLALISHPVQALFSFAPVEIGFRRKKHNRLGPTARATTSEKHFHASWRTKSMKTPVEFRFRSPF